MRRHGFFLGEFGLYDKRLMYEPSIKIPMLMRWPDGIAPKQVDDGALYTRLYTRSH